MYAALVYQNGIANVFACLADPLITPAESRQARRMMQHAFSPCLHFARGLAAAGWTVRTLHCPVLGDCARSVWHSDLSDAPFADKLVRATD